MKNTEEKLFFSNLIINTISGILTIPIFIIVHKLVPNPDWIFHLDRILLLVSVFLVLRFFLKEFELIVVSVFIVFILWLSYGTFWGGYGFDCIYEDYQEMVSSMIKNPHPEQIIVPKLVSLTYKNRIKKAINFYNPEVRNYALSLTRNLQYYSKRYSKYRTTIQSLEIFREINSKWNYVSDPKGREYYAKASESIKHLSGDCDDYAICMAACIQSIGGVARLVMAESHLYPELLIGTKKDLESIGFLVRNKLFIKESHNQDLNCHVDENNQLWLNLDYTAKYPGGPFMSKEILAIFTLD